MNPIAGAVVMLSVVACAFLLRPRLTPWTLVSVSALLFLGAAAWIQPFPINQVSGLLPAVIIGWVLPGYLVLELLFPRLSRRLDVLERAPLLFCLSLSVWTVIAAVAFRLEPRTDLVIGVFLVIEVVGLVCLAMRLGSHGGVALPVRAEKAGATVIPYLFILGSVLIGVSAVVGVTAPFQSYAFDSSFHLAGYNKIALNEHVLAVNPYLGPGHSYHLPYTANPGYLAFGLTARLAHVDVTWLYVCLAAFMTPLFFLTMYSLVRVMLRHRWIALVATLLAVGPWIAKYVLSYAPLGTFYLQFLPYPATYVQLIVFPIWITFIFRYIDIEDESGPLSVLLAAAAMGCHPVPLMLLPYSMGLLLVIALWFGRSRRSRRRSITLFTSTVFVTGCLAYIVFQPPGVSSWTKVGLNLLPEVYKEALLSVAWVLSPDLYAIHPKYMFENYWLFFASVFVLGGFIVYRPLIRSLYPAVRGIQPENQSQSARWPLALAVITVAVGPFLLVCNPFVVPWLVRFITATPITRAAGQLETVVLACQYGAMTAVLWAAMLPVRGLLFTWSVGPRSSVAGNSPWTVSVGGNTLSAVVTIALVVGALVFPLAQPRIRSLVTNMLTQPGRGILGVSEDPLLGSLARLDRGVVAIDEEQAEYLLMASPHYVMSSGRMTDERRRHNETIVRFGEPPDEMRKLLGEYGVTYVVVRRDAMANELVNGDFLETTAGAVTDPPSRWDAVVSSSIAGVPDGVSGPGLELSPSQPGYPSQFTYQNVLVRAGAEYRLEGYVKSGTSGNESFAIEVFSHNVGTKQLSIDGQTTASWVNHFTSFIAPESQLSVVLRKNSPTVGTMLFDEISLAEVGAAIERFRGQPDMFTEVITSPEYVVFEVSRAITSREH